MSARLRLLLAGAVASLFAAPAALSAQSATAIRFGQTVNGSLGKGDLLLQDDSWMDEYVFAGERGQRVRIRLSSSDFDAYLMLGTGTGSSFEQIEMNDDSDGLNAMLEVTLSSSGRFTIRANSNGGGETGAYVLSLELLGGGMTPVKGDASAGAAPMKLGDRPAPTAPPVSGQEINVCVVAEGAPRLIRALYNPASGDTTVNGRQFRDVYGSGPYAAGTSWFINNEAMTVNGRRYVKYGLPRVLGPNEVTRHADFRGVTVFGEAGVSGVLEIVYVPVRYGCEFQPYQLELGSVRG